MKKLLFLFLLCSVIINAQAQGASIKNTNRPIYKIGDTIQLRGSSIKTLKLKSFANRDSFVVNTFISKLLSNTDTLYNFIVPNTVKNDIYLINAFNYTNQLSDSIRLVRFIPNNIDSLGVWGANWYSQINIFDSLKNVVQIAGGEYFSLALKGDGTVVAWGSNDYGKATISTGLNNVVQISGGNYHSLALKADGTVVAWGYNGNGQTSIPAGLNNVVQIASGGNHNLVLKADGTLVAWGGNSSGQTSIPAGLNNVVQIVAGGNNSMALKADSTVVAWGDNSSGQTNIPVGLNNVVQIVAGGYHSLALKADSTVIAWGNNYYGQSNIPAGLKNVIQVVAGDSHSIALKTDGTLVAWGNNYYGQTSIPAGLNNVVQIAAGGNHNLALYKLRIKTELNTGGTISPSIFVKNGDTKRITYQASPGYFIDSIFINGVLNTDSFNSYTFSNINSSQKIRVVFIAITAPSKPRNVDVKVGNKKALLSFLPPANFGSKIIVKYIVKVLGTNIKDSSASSPINITGLTIGQNYNITIQAVNNEGVQSDTVLVSNIIPINVTEIISTNNPTYKIGDTIQLRGNGIKTLKLKSFASRDSFVITNFITKTPINSDTNYTFIVPNTVKNDVYKINGYSYTNQLSDSFRLIRIFAIQNNKDSLLIIAGWNNGGLISIPEKFSNVVQVASCYDVYLALKTDGTVVAYGSNYYGQTNIPADLNNVVQVVVGYFLCLALKADGTVVSWGYGQTSSIPADINNVVQVAASYYLSLALKADGSVVAWGNNNYNGQTNIPTGLNKVVQISAGRNHNLALKADGTVVAWGDNNYGQTNIPTGLNKVVQISAGENHNLALKADGTVVAWGYNYYGQTNIPAGLNKVVQISGGRFHSMALKEDGYIVAWGGYYNGQTFIPAGLNYVVQIAAGNYNLALYKIQIKTELNIGGTISPSIFVKNGDTKRITYQASPGYFIDSIFINGLLNTDSLNSYTFSNINSSQKIRIVFTAITAPSKPRNVKATVGNKKALLNFLPPTNFGSKSIVKYIANVLGTNIKDSSATAPINITGLTIGQNYNITIQAVNNEGVQSDTVLVSNIIPINVTEIISTNNPTYKIGDTIQLRGNGIKTLKIKSYASRDSFVITNFITKTSISSDTNYSFIVPNTVKNDVYLINAFSYTNQLSDSLRLVRFIPNNIDSLGVIGWGNNGSGQTNIPASLNKVVQIEAGSYHSLALKADGTVLAWGANWYGQTTIFDSLKNVVKIAAGIHHNLALRADGTVVVWGYNYYGQTNIPAGLNNVVQVVSGYYHSLALKTDGKVVAWGLDSSGQTIIPAGLNNVVQISAGGKNSMALKADSTVVVWGDNSYGQTNIPVGLNNVVQIATGGKNSMALKADSTVVVWGDNSYGQKNIPAVLNNVIQIVAGGSYSIALKADGTLVAWGNNANGQTSIPAELNNVVQIAAGGEHNLALYKLQIKTELNIGGTISPSIFVKNGDTKRITYQASPGYFIDSIFINGVLNTDSLNSYTFSNINSSQKIRVVFTAITAPSKPRNVNVKVGNKKAILSFLPPANFGSKSIVKYIVKVLGTNIKDSSASSPINITGLTIGQNYHITIQAVNNEGLISDTALVPNIVPINVTEIISTNKPIYKIGDTIQIRGNGIKTLKIKSYASRDSFVITNFINKIPISSDTNYTFIVPNTVKNDVYKINGYSYTNQLSDSFRLIRIFAIQNNKDSLLIIAFWNNNGYQSSGPEEFSNVIQVATCNDFYLALKSDGTVVAYGSNYYGQTNIPAGLNNVVQISAGLYHTVALKEDGTIVAWGRGNEGQTSIPVGLNNVVQIAAGGNNSMALQLDGTVVAWGANSYGQTNIPAGLNNVVQIVTGGDNSMSLKSDGTVVAWGKNWEGQTNIPIGLNNVVQIVAGYNHNLALKVDGTVIGWGQNWEGQTSIPTGLSNVVQIVAGANHSMAIKEDGTAVAWGKNWEGQTSIPIWLNNNFVVQIAAGEYILVLYKKQIKTESNYGGTISPSIFVKNGDTKSITYQASPGYFIDSIFINGVLNTDSLNSYTFSNINSSQKIRVVFTVITAPNKPRNVKATVGNKKALLNFLPPTNFGSKSIVKYIANVLGTNIKDSSATAPINITGLTIGQNYNITIQAVNNEGVQSDTVLVSNIIPINVTEIISTNNPTYKIGDTIQLRGNSIKTLKLKSFASRDSFIVTNFFSKQLSNSDTLYNFIVPNTVKKDVYLISAYNYTNQLSDSIRLVRFIPINIDSLGVISWGQYSGWVLSSPADLNIKNVVQIAIDSNNLALHTDGTVVIWGINGYRQIPPNLEWWNLFSYYYSFDYIYRQTHTPIELNNVVQIAAGGNHNLALKVDGTVVALGYNNYGQTNIPFGLKNVVQVVAGVSHSIALKKDGTLAAWGYNGSGQTNIPLGLNDVLQIAAGGNNSMALKADSTVVVWGDNSYGQTNIPVDLNKVVEIVAGRGHCLALKADSTVIAWGNNNYGQTNIPTGLNNVIQIVAGGSYSIALKADGTLVAWGNNANGQTSIPAELNNVVQIAAGGEHNLALFKLRIKTELNIGGTISPSIFVKNGDTKRITYQASHGYFIDSIFINGVLNTNSFSSYTFSNINSSQKIRVVFTAIKAPSKPRNVEVKVGNKKALLSFLPPTNFGSKSIVKYIAKVLGTNIKDSSTTTAITLTGLTIGQTYNITVQAVNNEGLISDTALVLNIVSITVTEIISTNKPTYKIGDTIQLRGNGIKTLKLKSYASRDSFVITDFIAKTPINSDTNYTFIVPNTVKNDVYLIRGYSHTNQLSDSIRFVRFFVIPNNIDSLVVLGWGDNRFSQTSIPIDLKNVMQIVAGDNHSMALKKDGMVVAWGNDSNLRTFIPAGLNNVVQISAGGSHSMALKIDGTVIAWGDNYYGQTNSPEGLYKVVQISAGEYHNLALKADGTVVAWGYNYYGQTNIPAGLNKVVQISGGRFHSMALKEDGTVVAWGYNQYNQTNIPSGLNNVVQISAGGNHSIALKAEGTLVAWDNYWYGLTNGLNNVLQTAIGKSQGLALKKDGNVVVWDQSNIPLGLNNVVQIAAGGYHSLAIAKLYVNTITNIGGTISPITFVKYGDSLRITYQPKHGYYLDSIIVNGVINRDSTTGYTFKNINQFQSLRVVFKPKNIITQSIPKYKLNFYLNNYLQNNIYLDSNSNYRISYSIPNGYYIDSFYTNLGENLNKDSVFAYTFTNINANRDIFLILKQKQINVQIIGVNGNQFSININDRTLAKKDSTKLSYFYGNKLNAYLQTDSNFYIDSIWIDNSVLYSYKKQASSNETNPINFYNLNINNLFNNTIVKIKLGQFTPPTPPRLDTVIVANAQAYLYFTLPTNNGGVSILKYEVSSINQNIKLYATQSPVRITGLQNDSNYQFVIKAINKVGTSIASNVSNVIIPKNNVYVVTTNVTNGLISGGASITNNGTYRVTYQANSGFQLDKVYVNDTLRNDSTQGYTFKNFNRNQYIYVVFKPIIYKLLAQSNNGGMFILNRESKQQINISTNAGSNNAIIIQANYGYKIDSIFVNNVLKPFTNKQLTQINILNILGDSTIRVVFKKASYVVKINYGKGGQVYPSNQINVLENDSINIRLFPNYGYEVDSIFINNQYINTSVKTNYWFKNVQGDSTIRVVFKNVLYSITSSVKNTNGGIISPAGKQFAQKGENKTYYIIPYYGYKIDTIWVNEIAVIINPNATSYFAYTFKNIQGDSSIKVSYKKNRSTIVSAVNRINNIRYGRITPSGKVTLINGQGYKYKIIPNSNGKLDSILIDNKKVLLTLNADSSGYDTATQIYTFKNIQSDKSINVFFSSKPAVNNYKINANEYTIISSSNLENALNVEGENIFSAGDNFTYTFEYDTLYYLDSLIIDGVVTNNYLNINNSISYAFTNINANHSIRAVFKKNIFTIISEQDGNGNINYVGTNYVKLGAQIKYSYQAESNYFVDSVIVNGVLIDSPQSFTFTNVQQDNTIKIIYNQSQYTIQSSVTEGGNINPLGTLLLNKGETYTYQYSANAGYSIDSVIIDGIVNYDSLSSYTFTNVQTNHRIQIVYKKNYYTITSSKNIEGGLISNEGINIVVNGSTQLYFIQANAGYKIDSIYINNIGQSINQQTYIYEINNINKDINIYVIFKNIYYTITASAEVGGGISPIGNIQVKYDSSQAFSITPNTGYVIDSVIVNGVNVGKINSYTFNNVKGDSNIRVTFKLKTFSITATAGTGGSISPQATTTLNYGTSQRYIITANTGYVIDSVIVNGFKVDSTTSYTFNNITANQTIQAVFKIAVVCPQTKLSPNIVRVGDALKSDITTFAKQRWYLAGTIKDSTTNNTYTPTDAGVYTLLGIDALGCESNLSKKYYYAKTCITPAGRLGNGANIQANIVGNANLIIIKWCTEIIQENITIKILSIDGVSIYEQKVPANLGVYIINKQQINNKNYVIEVIDNKGEVLQISDVVN